MTAHANLLPVYQRHRQVGRALSHKLVSTLSKEDLDEGGRTLGILRDGVLVFDSEDETSVLMDYCIYNVYRKGRNAVQRYWETSPPPAGSDEFAVLNAMRKARYTIVRVTGVERGVGVTVHDMLSGETDFLVDVGFSHSTPTNLLMAGRVLPYDGFLTTGGASLPITGASGPRVADVLKRMKTPANDLMGTTPEWEAELAGKVIRACLETGASSHIAYADAGESPSRSRRSESEPVRVRANRNDPCPCGSGRKYKSCCGKR